MVVLGSEWPKNCWITSRGASFTAMLVPMVWRMECGEMAFVMSAARAYLFTMFCNYLCEPARAVPASSSLLDDGILGHHQKP